GPPIRPTDTMAEGEAAGVKFAQGVKAPAEAAEAIKYLRSISGPALLKMTSQLGANDGTLLRPLIDGYLTVKYPALRYEQGEEMPIPMIVGGNAREEARGYSRAAMLQVVQDNFASLAP